MMLFYRFAKEISLDEVAQQYHAVRQLFPNLKTTFGEVCDFMIADGWRIV